MSQFREWAPKPKEDEFRFEDRVQLDKLMEGKKLTEKQREALRRLLASYDYATD